MSNAPSLRVPKYRHHKGKGLAVVTLNGRDVYLGKYGTAASREEYRRLIAEWCQRQGTAEPNQPGISLAEVMVSYLKFAQRYYRKRGKATREYEIIRDLCCKFLRPLYGRTPAAEFGPLRLKAIRQLMVDADHCRGYINKNVDRIRRMFTWAAAEELIPASVPQSLAMVAGLRKGRSDARETGPVLPVDDEVVNATLPFLPIIVADMVRLQRLTGMRPQDVCAVRPCDIDRSGDVWIFTPESHKTEHHEHEHKIFIGPKGQQILGKYLDRGTDDHCFRPCDSEARRRTERHLARKVPISCGNKPGTNRVRKPRRQAGESYDTNSYRRAIHRACDKAFPAPDHLDDHERAEWISGHRWSPNRLRHSAGTEVRRQFGLEAAQVILGHRQANVTQVYAERDMAKGLEVAALIG